MPQLYETVIAGRERGEDLDPEFRFLCLPLAAIHQENRDLVEDPPRLLEVLGLTEAMALPVGQLPDAVFALLVLEGAGTVGVLPDSVQEMASDRESLDALRHEFPDLALFAEYLTFAEVVPFEQSKVSGQALASLAMKSYTPASSIYATGATAAPHLGPHGAVVYLATAAAAGALAVVDSIGVVVGVATNPRTYQLLAGVRRGLRRLIHRPRPAPAAAEPVTESAPEPTKTLAEPLEVPEWLTAYYDQLREKHRPMLGDVML